MSDERLPDTKNGVLGAPSGDDGLAPGSSPDAAAERAARRRSRSKLTLRIPDDEVARPTPTPIGAYVPMLNKAEPDAATRPTPAPDDAPIMPMRIIDVGGSAPPPRSADAPAPAATGSDDSWTPYQPSVADKSVPSPGAYSSLDISVDISVDELSMTTEMRSAAKAVDDLATTSEVPIAALSSSLLFDADASQANVAAITAEAAERLARASSRPPAPGADVPISIPRAGAIPSELSADATLVSEASAMGDDAAEAALRALDALEGERESARESARGDVAELEADDVMTEEPIAARATAARTSSTPAARPSLPPNSKQEGKAPPLPPPAQRAPSSSQPTPSPPSVGDASQRRKTRAWWEEMFGEDYLRAMAKISDEQIATEVDFIEDSLGVAKGGTMLDLACGTGRHAIEFARRGYQAVGFDLSLTMLARAADEAQDRDQKLNFVQGDMREMPFENAFDGVYCWNTSFGFFDEEKNASVIGKVHRALRAGGQFVLDVVNRDFIASQAPSLVWFEGDGCVCMDEMQIDWITSRMRVKRTMMIDDGRSKEIEYSIRVYSLHELGKLLHDQGFRIAEVSGRAATPGVFFGAESPRTLILAEKR
jgi:SAM-dependent methyltransferase